MANKIIKGKDLMLFDKDKHSIAFATNHTLTITAETTDISSKDHGKWGASEVAKYTWEITSENLYTEASYDALFTQMIAGTKSAVYFAIKAEDDSKLPSETGDKALDYWTSGTTAYSGNAIITSLTANANNGENATFSITLTGVGPISKTTVAAS